LLTVIGCQRKISNARSGNINARNRSPCRGRRQELNLCDEAIASARECLYVSRRIDGIRESVAEFVDSGVEAVIEIHESVGRPKFGAKLFTSDEAARCGEENHEDIEGLT